MPTSGTITEDEDNYPAVMRYLDDGDPASGANFQEMAQDSADRTAYTLKRLRYRGAVQVNVSGGPVGGGSFGAFTLALDQQSGGYTVASNKIQVPAPGWYKVTGNIRVTADSSPADDQFVGAQLETGAQYKSAIVDGDADSTVQTVTPVILFYITNPATQRIEIGASNAPTVGTTANAGSWAIVEFVAEA